MINRETLEKIQKNVKEIRQILPNLVEYNDADKIETNCNEILDLLTEKLWDEFEDVLFVETENGTLVLHSEWNGFDAGTDRDTIWHWFDKMHSKGINWLLNGIDVKTENER